MESPPVGVLQHPHHYGDGAASRPYLGFPLGTALLLIVIFSLSGIFSCCYHWDKLRNLRGAYSDDVDLEAASHDEKPNNSEVKRMEIIQSLPVIMPGDEVPTFIALPCPCAPPCRPGGDSSPSTSAPTVHHHVEQKPPPSPVPPS